jgi:hypothetical protein
VASEIESIVPYQEKWGIYELDPQTGSVNLIYSTSHKITTLRLNDAGNTFVFFKRIDGDEDAKSR